MYIKKITFKAFKDYLKNPTDFFLEGNIFISDDIAKFLLRSMSRQKPLMKQSLPFVLRFRVKEFRTMPMSSKKLQSVASTIT